MRVEERAQQVSGVVFAGVWMWPLFGPVMNIVHGEVHPAVVAGIGFVAFVVPYLVVVVDAFDDRPRLSRRMVWLLNIVVAVVGLLLAAGYATVSNSWLEILLYVAVTGAATMAGSVSALLWIAGWTVVMVVVGLVRGLPWSDVGSLAFSSVMAGMLVFTIRQMVRLIRELKRTQRELANAAVERERLRFSRDLHDLLGHTLSLMVVKAELTRRLAPIDGEAAAREADDIETIGRQALLEVREAVTGYRARSLAQELDGARYALTHAGIEVVVSTAGTLLAPDTDDMFGWAVREGVTNVIRHSRATRCEIHVHRLDDCATLTITDNGIGTPTSDDMARDRTGPVKRVRAQRPHGPSDISTSSGNGLRGLAERARSVGGALSAVSTPATGFTLTVTVPVTSTSTSTSTSTASPASPASPSDTDFFEAEPGKRTDPADARESDAGTSSQRALRTEPAGSDV